MHLSQMLTVNHRPQVQTDLEGMKPAKVCFCPLGGCPKQEFTRVPLSLSLLWPHRYPWPSFGSNLPILHVHHFPI